MKKKKKKIVLAIIMLVVLLFGSGKVNAEINGDYNSQYIIDSIGLNESMENSTVLNLIGHLVYAVGRLLEWILGAVFESITGSSNFPWADRIVFNAVPILDVNFINPNKYSFVGTGSVKSAISNAYATIFSISLSFFGIFAMISAIKLAISTIADQKAKYKQALIDWTLGFVMLFCVHYFMSFMFYLNEELVKSAYSVAQESISTAGAKYQIQASALSKELIDSVKKYDSDKGKYLEKNTAIIQVWMGLDSSDYSKGIHNLMKNDDIFWDKAITNKNQMENLFQAVTWINNTCPSVDELREIQKKTFYIENGVDWVAAMATAYIFVSPISAAVMAIAGPKNTNAVSMLSKTNYDSLKLSSLKSNLVGNDVMNVHERTFSSHDVEEMYDDKDSLGNFDLYEINSNGNAGKYLKGSENVEYINSLGIKKGSSFTGYYSSYNWNFYQLISDLISLKAASQNQGKNSENGGNNGVMGAMISELATYFKETSYDMELRGTDVTGTKKDTSNINTTNAIMYAIMVAQSLILFISYIKRLFYVIILGLMSPAVVAYDFFKRFGR